MKGRIPLPSVSESKVSPELMAIKKDVEVTSFPIRDISDKLVSKYCKQLDDCVDEIRNLLKEDDIQPQRLNYYIALLPTLIYYAGNSIEDLGVESDVAESIRREAFNVAYMESFGKTINDKTSEAEQLVVSEKLISDAFSRAYKKAKNKIENSTLLHGSLKKVLQWKISELEVTGSNTSSSGTDMQVRGGTRR